MTKAVSVWVPYEKLHVLLSDLQTLNGTDLRTDLHNSYAVRVTLSRWQVKRLMTKLTPKTLEEVYGG